MRVASRDSNPIGPPNNAYLYAKVEYRAILICADGTTEDHRTQGFTVSPGGTQSGEMSGMWWRGCGDRISGVRLIDVSVDLVDMTGYHWSPSAAAAMGVNVSPMRDRTNALLANIASTVDGLDNAFATGGNARLSEPLSIRFRDGACVTLGRHAPPSMLDALLARSVPAPFGHRGETRVDPAVRAARQIRCNDEHGEPTFEVIGFDPETSGVLDVIVWDLSASDPRDLTAELYALNIYEPGGHFVAHKDTPRGADMIGSLVVCLPSTFEGGMFSVGDGSEEMYFDWAGELVRDGDDLVLPYAAFFADVEHVVHEVTSGARVTLSYLLRRSAGDAGTRPDAPPQLRDQLRDALADEQFLPDGGVIHIPCRHMYRTVLNQAALELTDCTHILKGRDQLVAGALLETGLPARLVPCMTENEYDHAWRLPRYLTRDEIEAMPDQVAPYNTPMLEYEHRIDVDVMTDDFRARREELFCAEYSPTDYFGNESERTEFYAFAAFEVQIARFTERSSPSRA